MINYGVDALILEGNEAGGHIGPVSINVLVQEILPKSQKFRFVAVESEEGNISKIPELGAAGCK